MQTREEYLERRRQYSRWYRETQPREPRLEKMRIHARIRNIMLRLDISEDAARRLLDTIPERCQICGRKTALVEDHDHTVRTHRGWLCQNCNRALGLLGDSRANLQNALEYLDAGQP